MLTAFASEDELGEDQYIYDDGWFDRDLRRNICDDSSDSDLSTRSTSTGVYETQQEHEQKQQQYQNDGKSSSRRVWGKRREKRTSGKKKKKKKEKKQHRSALMEIIRNLRIGTDLLSFRAFPTWILKPKSICEMASDICMPLDDMVSPEAMRSEKDRFLQILRTALFSIGVVPQKGFHDIKPYNSILGECFRCKWQHPDGSQSICIVEQVSHHPPITALRIENIDHGHIFDFSLQPLTRFWGNSVEAHMAGKNTITLKHYNDETYVLKEPTFWGKGILWGESRAELGGEMVLTCERTGWEAVISYEKENAMSGSITYQGEIIYDVSGCLTEEILLKDVSDGTMGELLDRSTAMRTTVKKVAPLVDQESNESRRVWHRVTRALRQGEQDDALRHKSAIEERQRRLVKEHGNSHYHTPRFFVDTGSKSSEGIPVFKFKGDINDCLSASMS